MKKNVLFDLDGTLLDTTEGILESVKYTVNKLGFEELPYEKQLRFVGPPIQESFIKYYNCSSEQAQGAVEIFRDYYKNKALFKAVPYAGIYELFDLLKSLDVKMAVATYKREDYALKILEYFKFNQYCCSMHGGDNENKLKKSDIVNICLDELQCNKKDCVLVGDTIHDAKGAADAQIPFIAVTYGFGFKTEEELKEYPCVGIAESPKELVKIIERL
ncbi:HAD family hydrolase [Firmicutes bacterium i23-0019-B6]